MLKKNEEKKHFILKNKPTCPGEECEIEEVNEDREYLAEIVRNKFLSSWQTEHGQVGHKEAPVSIILNSPDHFTSAVLPDRRKYFKS